MELQPYETFERPEPRFEVMRALAMAWLDRDQPAAAAVLADHVEWSTFEERRAAREAVLTFLNGQITRWTANADQLDAWLRDHDGGAAC